MAFFPFAMAEGKFMRLYFEMFSTSWMRAGSAGSSSARAASCSAPVVAEVRVDRSRTRCAKGEGTTTQGSQKSQDSALQCCAYVVGICPKGFCLKPLICLACGAAVGERFLRCPEWGALFGQHAVHSSHT